MKIALVKNGKVELRNENGSLARTIGNNDAVSAEFNNDQSLVVMTTITGKCEIRKENGLLVRTIGNGDVVLSKWYGADIALKTIKGKTEIRKVNGLLIRTL